MRSLETKSPTNQIFLTVEVLIQAFVASSIHHIVNQLLVY